MSKLDHAAQVLTETAMLLLVLLPAAALLAVLIAWIT